MSITRFAELPPHLLQHFITLLLYRCGGQQTFTPEEIIEIQKIIGGVTMKIDKEHNVTLKCQTRDALREKFPTFFDEQES